jgi:death-on-curing protein
MLSSEDVLAVHEALIADFADTSDPISPSGVRSIALLESAVSRQHTSLGDRLKYPDPIPNAATLLYGICCDHPFHNGNKRTALVSMLVHLDGNRLTLYGTSQKDLFSMVLGVADHSIGLSVPRRSQKRGAQTQRRDSDEEVEAIADWLRKRAERVQRGERQTTYRELRRILGSHGYYLEAPDRNYIEVVRYEEQRVGILRRQSQKVRKRIGTIGWPGEHETIGIKEIKNIRKLCRLTETDGVDSAAFYDRTAVIDSFVNDYRGLLRKLARR